LVVASVKFYCFGDKFFFPLFIFFPVEENEPKEARVPLIPARRRCGRSTLKRGNARTVRALYAARRLDARRGPKRIETDLQTAF